MNTQNHSEKKRKDIKIVKHKHKFIHKPTQKQKKIHINTITQAIKTNLFKGTKKTPTHSYIPSPTNKVIYNHEITHKQKIQSQSHTYIQT